MHAWQDGDVVRLELLNSRATCKPRYSNGYADEAWMYGIALEAMAQAHLLTKRKEMPDYMRRVADFLLANPQETGEEKATDRLKLFAQYLRNSQRFLWYLSEEARGPMAEATANR